MKVTGDSTYGVVRLTTVGDGRSVATDGQRPPLQALDVLTDVRHVSEDNVMVAQ